MSQKVPYRTIMCCAVSLVLACLTGCRPAKAPQTDIESAKVLIEKALDAWLQGSSVADMRSLDPPIYVADDAWQAGNSLEKYTISRPGDRWGTNVRFYVNVVGTDRNGKQFQRDVKYLVATVPSQSVARDDR